MPQVRGGTVKLVENPNFWNEPGVTVPCKFCGNLTPMLGTKLCNPCWEAERQIERIASTPGLRALMTRTLKNAEKGS